MIKSKRLSMRDVLARNNRADALYAGMAGVEPQAQAYIAPKREQKPREINPLIPYEHDIQNAIISYLLHHPKVGLVERHNSGTMEGEYNGKRSFTKFHTVYMRGVRKVDLDVMLKDGRRLVIEVKRPPWTHPRDQREEEQSAYLQAIVACGGLGIFATCVEDVMKALA